MGFKIIIVGGSVSGLSLANMLEKFNIEYVLLEAHAEIAPQLGASIGLLPGGLRILDQLGCYESIRELAGDCYYQPSLRLFDGRILDAEKPVSFSAQLEQRTGYPRIFVDRRMLLQVLFDNIQFKDRILTRKRVVRVDTTESCVHVQTHDGAEYTGDIVVGADGVHSAVRKEMWRIGRELDLEAFPVGEDQELVSNSKCIFGISKRPESLPTTPLQINAFFDGRSHLGLSAPGDRLYWFLFTDMEKATGSDIPRFTKDDEVALAKKHYDDQLTRSATFGDVYRNRLHTALVPLEEHVFERWHFRRIITIGDAAHKVHPYSAQGGNGALETAAALVNALLRELDHSSALSQERVGAVFAEVQAGRLARAVSALEQGRRTSSISTSDTLSSRLIVHFLVPWFGDRILMWLMVRHAATGPVIERLPLPARRGVTLPHGGGDGAATVARSGGGKAPWGLGVSGAALVAAMLLYSGRSSGWSDPFVTLFEGYLGHM